MSELDHAHLQTLQAELALLPLSPEAVAVAEFLVSLTATGETLVTSARTEPQEVAALFRLEECGLSHRVPLADVLEPWEVPSTHAVGYQASTLLRALAARGMLQRVLA